MPAYYQYSWEVKDVPSGNDYRQQETRDGHLTTGLYQVLLPGGRHQVSFTPFLFLLKIKKKGGAFILQDTRTLLSYILCLRKKKIFQKQDTVRQVSQTQKSCL